MAEISAVDETHEGEDNIDDVDSALGEV